MVSMLGRRSVFRERIHGRRIRAAGEERRHGRGWSIDGVPSSVQVALHLLVKDSVGCFAMMCT